MSIFEKFVIKKIKYKLFVYKEQLLIILCVVLSIILILLVVLFVKTMNKESMQSKTEDIILSTNNNIKHRKSRSHVPEATNVSCNFFTCFNVYRCGVQGNNLLVYVYPFKNYTNYTNQLTREYYDILQNIIKSKYYTSNPEEACLFIPSLDTLSLVNINFYSFQALQSLEFWNKGENHLVFTTVPFEVSEYHSNILVGKAMIIASGHSSINYRPKFDISFPIISPFLRNYNSSNWSHRHHHKKWFAVSSQLNIDHAVKRDLIELQILNDNDVKILSRCRHFTKLNPYFRCIEKQVEVETKVMYKYPGVLENSIFCLIVRGDDFGLSLIIESLATGCVPVIIYDSLVLPFHEVLDWARVAVFIREVDIMKTINLLKDISVKKIKELRNHGYWMYKKYFRSIKKITETTLEILNDRIFPHLAKNYLYWNIPEHETSYKKPPLFLPVTAPKTEGFTAVILTYDRVDFLFSLVSKLSKVPSLTKILVIWNNQAKAPPKLAKWPKIAKALKVIQTKENMLSNRFYPYDEIETEAVLSIDDDILMLTEDEVEFAYEVWREFPDRIVGFPSRIHRWDNKTMCWKYESEWMNEISMVLTGAAFYHKYWNYAYTVQMPGDIKEWVDSHMNCEDIAMNFLVSNITRKAPIKVTAKKKFRCPECTNTEMLSADLTHMVERTQCINQFTNIFGYMPLIPVEFRADPVLYKDNIPDQLKRFSDVGSL